MQGDILSIVQWNKQEDTIVATGKDGFLCIWDVFTGKWKATSLKNGLTIGNYNIKFDATDKNFFVTGHHLDKVRYAVALFFAVIDSNGHCLAYYEIPGAGGSLYLNPDDTLFIAAPYRLISNAPRYFHRNFPNKNPTFVECVESSK